MWQTYHWPAHVLLFFFGEVFVLVYLFDVCLVLLHSPACAVLSVRLCSCSSPAASWRSHVCDAHARAHLALKQSLCVVCTRGLSRTKRLELFNLTQLTNSAL